jgi:hypothetical protein
MPARLSSTRKCFVLLGGLLLSGTGIQAAQIMAFKCGAVVGNITNNNDGTFTLGVTCADGVTFNGTSSFINTGGPSDLLIRGVFRDVPGGAFTDNFPFSLDSYTLPLGPKVEAWHELHGTMNLGNTQPGTAASLTAANGFLTGASGVQCATGGVTTGLINGSFNVAEVPHAMCMDNPNWTRGVTLTTVFNAGVSPNGSITMGQGSSDNFFQGVPEPATWMMLCLGGGFLAARRFTGRLFRGALISIEGSGLSADLL